ncbi:hypothetical protein MKS83_04630 [Chryseobacterium sp. Y16C]|uniref:hypothetical protein n=1 Tax=Chryseobacterium sp. Y16C TaxID=2920939 RepID=UPI001F0B59D9|nr:hypothetical protein [Chryseobacterium sp. Y16C]UMQ42977.1 hypothetical protein MKS83_04630 [Chryseobacterium sp. Y16C]
MAHEPKLSAYIIKLKPVNKRTEKTNRNLFRHIIGDTSSENLADSFIFLEFSRKFISAIDTNEMYSDENTKKSITANQIDIESENVNTNIRFHSDSFIIEGIIEGGAYGRKRKKTSTANKNNKSEVSEGDAITDDFYFLIYTPLNSDKSILLLQSYSDDNIDSVMKKFWKNLLCYPAVFNQPALSKYIPAGIIQDFRNGATISNLTYTTEIPSDSLLGNTVNFDTRNFKITIKIEPTDSGFTYDEFDEAIAPIEQTTFKNFRLGIFNKKKGSLKDVDTGKNAPFELDNNFQIKPSIILSKYVTINYDESDFPRIKEYCFQLLESIKQEIYLQNAVQER